MPATPPPSRRGAWMRRLAMTVLSGAALLSASAVQAQSGQDYARQAGAPLLGRLAPPLVFDTMDGDAVDLAALRGHKAVYLKFWASWCGPCREQMPHFEQVQRAAGDDLQVVAVNIGFDDTPAQIRDYRREHDLSMPIVHDADGRLGAAFGLRVTPQHVVIGKDGRVLHVGHLADAELEAALADARRAATPAAAREAPPIRGVAGPGTVGPGDAVPAVTVTSLEGYEVALGDPGGRRSTVLVFLSPWCESYFASTRPQSSAQCRALREQLVAHGRDRSVRWLGIGSGLWASEGDLRDYRNEHRIPVPLALDEDGALFHRFGVRRVPAVIVVDPDGRVAQRIDDIDDGLRDLLPAGSTNP